MKPKRLSKFRGDLQSVAPPSQHVYDSGECWVCRLPSLNKKQASRACNQFFTSKSKLKDHITSQHGFIAKQNLLAEWEPELSFSPGHKVMLQRANVTKKRKPLKKKSAFSRRDKLRKNIASHPKQKTLSPFFKKDEPKQEEEEEEVVIIEKKSQLAKTFNTELFDKLRKTVQKTELKPIIETMSTLMRSRTKELTRKLAGLQWGEHLQSTSLNKHLSLVTGQINFPGLTHCFPNHVEGSTTVLHQEKLSYLFQHANSFTFIRLLPQEKINYLNSFLPECDQIDKNKLFSIERLFQGNVYLMESIVMLAKLIENDFFKLLFSSEFQPEIAKVIDESNHQNIKLHEFKSASRTDTEDRSLLDDLLELIPYEPSLPKVVPVWFSNSSTEERISKYIKQKNYEIFDMQAEKTFDLFDYEKTHHLMNELKHFVPVYKGEE
ncbi:hypothetical protein PCE1_003111 [Barthelona sp. PCE]